VGLPAVLLCLRMAAARFCSCVEVLSEVALCKVASRHRLRTHDPKPWSKQGRRGVGSVFVLEIQVLVFAFIHD
jgi:hypothetical protein